MRSTSLKYREKMLISSIPAGGVESVVFVANGLTEVKPRLSGRVPGLDRKMRYQDQYVVKMAKMIAICTLTESYLESKDVICGIVLRDHAYPIEDAASAINDAHAECQYSVMGPTPATGACCVSKWFSTEFLGLKTEEAATLRGDVMKNPEEKAYFHLFFCPVTGETSGTIGCTVVIEYDVVLIQTDLYS